MLAISASTPENPTNHSLIVRSIEEPLEPLVGIEPTTYSLRMNCSTPELQRPNSLCGGRFLAKASRLATVIFEYVLVVSQSPVLDHSRILPIISRNWVFPRPSTIRTRSFIAEQKSPPVGEIRSSPLRPSLR